MQITKRNYKNIKTEEHLAQIVPCKNGFNTLVIKTNNKERYIHSKYDPVKEARHQIEEFTTSAQNKLSIIVFGLGMGYHLFEIVNTLPKGGRIYVFEPCPYVCRLFFENGGDSLLLDDRISFYTMSALSDISLCLPNLLTLENCDAFSFFALPVYTSVFPVEYDLLISEINRHTGKLLVQKNSIRQYGQNWSINFLYNYGYLKVSAGVCGLFSLFKGKTAIIVSAGPSLSKNVELLKNVDDRAIIVCTDTAYRVLLKYDIKPHILISVSGSNVAYTKLQGTNYDIPLVYKSQTDYRILQNHHGHKFYSRYINEFLDSTLAATGADPGYIDSGGSVACSALDLSVKMGVSNVIMIGQDLALTDDKAHAEYATSYLPNFVVENFVIETTDIYGGIIKTLKNLNAYKHWFEDYFAANKGVNYIDATEGGALIKGSSIMTLEHALSKYLDAASIDIAERISRAYAENRVLDIKRKKFVMNKYINSFSDYMSAKAVIKDIITKYNRGKHIAYDDVHAALLKLFDYTGAIKYSLLLNIFDLENMSIGKEPEKELRIFYIMANRLDELSEAYKNVLEEK